MREKPEEEHDTVAIRLHADQNQDLQRYNLPIANDDVAAIIPGDESEEHSDHRDIVLRLKGGCLEKISHIYPSYSTLHYVMLFPNGEDGWQVAIPAQVRAERRCRSEKVSQLWSMYGLPVEQCKTGSDIIKRSYELMCTLD